MLDPDDLFTTEGLITSGAVDLVWGRGWRAPNYASLRAAEGDAGTGDELPLPLRGVLFAFLRELPDALAAIERARPTGRFVVIARDGDSRLVNVLREGAIAGTVRQCEAVKHLFSVHTEARPVVTPMPFALRWKSQAQVLANAIRNVPRSRKNAVLCAHRTLNVLEPGHERFTADAYFGNKPWATFYTAPMEAYPIPYDWYVNEVRSHDYFVAASNPDGGERQALWEAMALGTIPICTRRTQARWANLPIALVDEWSDVTEQWCDAHIAELRSRSFEAMSLRYWVGRVEETARACEAR